MIVEASTEATFWVLRLHSFSRLQVHIECSWILSKGLAMSSYFPGENIDITLSTLLCFSTQFGEYTVEAKQLASSKGHPTFGSRIIMFSFVEPI